MRNKKKERSKQNQIVNKTRYRTTYGASLGLHEPLTSMHRPGFYPVLTHWLKKLGSFWRMLFFLNSWILRRLPQGKDATEQQCVIHIQTKRAPLTEKREWIQPEIYSTWTILTKNFDMLTPLLRVLTSTEVKRRKRENFLFIFFSMDIVFSLFLRWVHPENVFLSYSDPKILSFVEQHFYINRFLYAFIFFIIACILTIHERKNRNDRNEKNRRGEVVVVTKYTYTT